MFQIMHVQCMARVLTFRSDGTARHSMECILQRLHQRLRIGIQPRHCSPNTATPPPPRISIHALFAIQNKILEQHAGRDGGGNLLRSTQNAGLRSAVDQYHIRGKSKSRIVLCADYAYASFAAGDWIFDCALLYEIYGRESRME